MSEQTATEWPPYPFSVERYCVTSGRPVRMVPGDRCLVHGAADRPCDTDVRPAECTHEHQSPNHPYPHCSECGRDAKTTPASDGEVASDA